MDTENIRTALIFTLTVLLIAVLWRRFKRNVIAKEMPAPLHAELISLQVEYHPSRLHVVLKMPRDQTIHTELLDAAHGSVHEWSALQMASGQSTVELALPETTVDGLYHLEMRTATQRTIRQFRLQQG